MKFPIVLLWICYYGITVNGEDYNGRRQKRDNGGAFSDSGGPVAQCNKGDKECSKKSEFGEAGAVMDKMSICEALENKKSAKDGKKPKKGKGKGKAAKSKKAGLKKGGLREAKGMAKGAKHTGKDAFKKANDGKPNDDEIKEEFDKFKNKFGKSYSNPAEEAAAMKTFGENMAKVQKMMTQRRSKYDASFSMTKKSDTDFMEFIKKAGGYLPDIDFPPVGLDISALIKKRESCKELHWPKFGVVPSTRLQENCGCCYAHSAADLIATQYQIDKKEFDKSWDLSAQYLADCMPEPKAYKCKGGRSCDMLNYLATCKDCKIPTTSCYEYKDAEENCKQGVTCDEAPDIKVKWAASFDISGPFEKELMAGLLQHGPVVAVVGVTDAWQMYNGTGILKFGQCTLQQMHAVLITGYNYTSCVPTYRIKNSWGEEWGGLGDIKLEAGKNVCSVAKTVIALCTADDCPTNKAEYLSYLFGKSNYPDCQD